jgi:hypothetical protein
MKLIKIGDIEEIVVTRREANFDRACDEAYCQAVAYFGIDEDGHSDRVKDWERSDCWLEVEFSKYTRVGQDHCYKFLLHAEKHDPEQIIRDFKRKQLEKL